ncbi:MAG TPA: hypothetical protein VG733_17120 [Chthoniobacteraceae bacterium]|nr:hypothetical protein [Chthoniobacteraceae bacterium]
MQATFVQKFLLTIVMAFFSACLLWGLRHIVLEAMWETSDAGWKQSLYGKPTPKP